MDAIAQSLKNSELSQAWSTVSAARPIVFIGAGGIVRCAHLPAYQRLGLPVLGLHDARHEVAQAVAAQFGVSATYRTIEEAVEAGRRDGAIFDVAVPAEAVGRVLPMLPEESFVLIQKPLGRDLPEARQLLELCRRRRLRAAVNFQLRFSPNVLALKDAIARGLLGELVHAEVRVNVHTPWGLWDFLKGIPRHEILYHSIHYLDLMRSLLGDPKGVHCRVTRNPALPEYSDTSSTIILDYGDDRGCVVSTFHGHDFGGHHAMSQLKVEGTLGCAVLRMGVNLDYPHGRPDTLELSVKGSATWHQVPLRGDWFDEAFEGTMSNMQRFANREDELLVTSVEDAARTMALVEACYRSSQSGGTPLPEVF